MICKKCKTPLPDSFNFCPKCGAEQRPQKRRKKRHNGAGTIYKRPGNHSRPYIARITVSGELIYLGSYKSNADAQLAIDQLAAKPKNDRFNITLGEIYEEWSSAYFSTLTKSGIDGYRAAWARLGSLTDIKVRSLRTDHLQRIINEATVERRNKETGRVASVPLSQSGKEKILQLASQLCKKAMEYDIIDKNYAEFVVLKRETPQDKEIFTDLEIAKLTEDGDKTSRIILTLIYSGMRINELFGVEIKNVFLADGYLIGGEKTEAGRNRFIPIHPKVMPYISDWMHSAKPGQKYLLVNASGQMINDDNFRKRDYFPKLEALGIPRRKPHTCRNTFATISRRAGMREEVLARILGHTSFTMTDKYITKTLDDLKLAMALIK